MMEEASDRRGNRVGALKRGQYAEGTPLHEVQSLECKLILETDEFTSAKGFRKYGRLVPQRSEGVRRRLRHVSAIGARPAIREVMFLDSEDHRRYHNEFILRWRVRFEDRFRRRSPRSCSSSGTRTSRGPWSALGKAASSGFPDSIPG